MWSLVNDIFDRNIAAYSGMEIRAPYNSFPLLFFLMGGTEIHRCPMSPFPMKLVINKKKLKVSKNVMFFFF